MTTTRTIYQVEFQNYNNDNWDTTEAFFFDTEQEARDYMNKNEIFGDVRNLNTFTFEFKDDEEIPTFKADEVFDVDYDWQFDCIEVEFLALDKEHNEINLDELLDEMFDENEEELQKVHDDEYYGYEDFASDCRCDRTDVIREELYSKYHDTKTNEELVKEFLELALRNALNK